METTPQRTNEFGQPVGEPVPGWEPRPRPPRTAIEGHYARVEPLSVSAHAASMFTAHATAADGRRWTYLPYGPFEELASFEDQVARWASSDDPFFYALVDLERGEATGAASYLRIDSANGSIEVGHVQFSPLLAQTRAATDAMYLMMARAFDELGYRRYEWKCDSFNEPSKAAAVRLGFQYEGRFRQAVVYRGRNRDHDWFSITNEEWPALKTSFEAWLDPSNFDAEGRQRTRLHAGLDLRK